MTENFGNFDQKWMGIVLPVLTNKKRTMPRLLISEVFFLTAGTKKEAQMAKAAAGYGLLREKINGKQDCLYT